MRYCSSAKKNHFPKLYASMLAAGVAVILIDALAIKLVMPEEPIFDYETTKGLIQSIAGAAIWIPYVYK